MSLSKQIESGEITLAFGTKNGVALRPQKEIRDDALRLIKQGESRDWVPVSPERLPSDGEPVDIFIKKYLLRETNYCYFAKHKVFYNMKDDIEVKLDEVSHWRSVLTDKPLPEPTREREDNANKNNS